MKFIKLLIAAVALFTAAACEEEIPEKKLETLDSIELSDWYCTGEKSEGVYIYYTLSFGAESQGTLTGYDAKEGGNVESIETFTYTHTRNNNDIAVTLLFTDGDTYAGYVIPKGAITVDYKDVFVLQLFKVDEDGMPIEDIYGNYDTMMFWKE